MTPDVRHPISGTTRPPTSRLSFPGRGRQTLDPSADPHCVANIKFPLAHGLVDFMGAVDMHDV